MADREAGLTDGEIPIQSQSVRFREGGIGRGHGILLLYPDKLAAVDSSAEFWGLFLGPIVLVAVSLLVHDLLALGAAAAASGGRLDRTGHRQTAGRQEGDRPAAAACGLSR